MITFEKFTDISKKIPALANLEAQRQEHNYIGAEHLLLGAVKINDPPSNTNPMKVLYKRGIDIVKVRLTMYDLYPSGTEQITLNKLPRNESYEQALRNAIGYAEQREPGAISPLVFLHGIINVRGDEKFSQLLEKLDIDPGEMSAEIEATLAAA